MELNNQRTYGTIRDRNQAAQQPPATHREPTIPEQLEKLDELRKRGVITEAEFTAKKAQLLDRM
jgi:cytochrome c-type biogenesis protein CcmH/NrfG